MIRMVLAVGLLLASVLSAVGQGTDRPALKPEQLKPAILYWDFGTLETIYRTQDETGTYWNVVHRSFEPEKESDGFDYYKVDAKTLRPVLSRMYHPNFIDYRIRFTSAKAALSIQDDKGKNVEYELDAEGFLAPEGPGTPLFFGSLPLREGFEIRFRELDRWSGKDARKGIIVEKKLRVVGVENIPIDGRDTATFRLEVSSEGGSSMTAWVLKAAPHYWVKTEYRPLSGKVFKGRVTKILFLQS